MNRSRHTPDQPRIGALALAVIVAHPRQSVATFMGAAAACVIMSNALFLQTGQHPAPLFASRTVTVPMDSVALPRPRVVEMTPPAPAPVAAPAAAPAAPRSRSDIVTDLQRDHARRGFYDGAVDGVWGSRTDTALRDFIQASGLHIAAEANEDVLRAVMQSGVVKSGRGDAAASRRDPIGDILSSPREVRPSQPVVAPQPVAAAPLPSGSRRLVAVQRALADFGYGQVKPTGTMGPDTQAAIERFERDRRMPVTGQLSDKLVRELGAVTGRPLD